MDMEKLSNLWTTSGFMGLDLKHLVMIVIACVLIYLAIRKKFEPLLLLPIAFGMLLANLPLSGIMDDPVIVDGHVETPGGLLYYLYQGVKLGIYPSLILYP
jgi:oxaloacetate decarboxylase beta subunit